MPCSALYRVVDAVARQQAAVDFRVQGFHPAVHDFRKAGHAADVGDRDAGFAQGFGGASGRQQLHAMLAQRRGQFQQSGSCRKRTAARGGRDDVIQAWQHSIRGFDYKPSESLRGGSGDGDLVLLDFFAQGGAVQAEDFRGPALVAATVQKHFLQQRGFDFGQAGRRAGRCFAQWPMSCR